LNDPALQNPEIYLSQDEDAVNDEKAADTAVNLRAKRYSKITDEQRRDFINAVENDGEKIINAAKRFDINYSSAKSILNVFKSEGRSIKKQFRDKIPKDIKNSSISFKEETGESSLNNFGQNQPQIAEKVKMKSNASTQTGDDSQQEDNSLVLLRDRLLASKTDKRQNPYEGLSSHEFARFSGSLNDYTQNQLFSERNLGANFDQNKTGQDYSSPGTVGNNQTMTNYGNAQPIQQYQLPQNDSNSRNSGMTNQSQFSGGLQFQGQNIGGGINQGQGQGQGLGGGFNYVSNNKLEQQNFEGLQRQQQQQQGGSQNNQGYGSMIYTGVNPIQYFMVNPNDQMKGMQTNQQFQYLQPVMYMMPSFQNVPLQQNNTNNNMNSNMNQPPPFYNPAENYNLQQNNYLGSNQSQDRMNNPPNQQRGGPSFRNQNSNFNG